MLFGLKAELPIFHQRSFPMRKLILVGGGGHAKSVIDVIEAGGDYQITGILDRKEKVGSQLLNYSITASDEELPQLVAADQDFLITIGQITSAKLREKLFQTISALGGNLATVISPNAYLSSYARIGIGTVVMHQALVNAGAKVGNNVIINSKALIEHDATIGDHCHIATGAVVNGGISIGNQVLIGSHATIKQGVQIADGVVVGAHAYVHRNITEAGIYTGVPARKFKNND